MEVIEIPVKYIDYFAKYKRFHISINKLLTLIKNKQSMLILDDVPRKKILKIAECPQAFFDEAKNKFVNDGIYFEKDLIENYMEPYIHGPVMSEVQFYKSFYLEGEKVIIYDTIDRFVNNTFHKDITFHRDIFCDSSVYYYDLSYLLNSYEWRSYFILLDSPQLEHASFCYNVYKLDRYNDFYSHTFKRYRFYSYPDLLPDTFDMIKKFVKFIHSHDLTKYFKDFSEVE